MKQYKKQVILLIFLVTSILLVRISGIDDYVTFENLKRNRESLQEFVKNHYILSVLCYIVIYISTAFFIPGAIPLTIAGGLLFGVFWGTVYVCIGATIGAALAFFSARYLIGKWTFLITAIPGTVIYTFAGQQVGTIESIEDIYSHQILIAFLLLTIFVFSPIVLKYRKSKKGR